MRDPPPRSRSPVLARARSFGSRTPGLVDDRQAILDAVFCLALLRARQTSVCKENHVSGITIAEEVSLRAL